MCFINFGSILRPQMESAFLSTVYPRYSTCKSGSQILALALRPLESKPELADVSGSHASPFGTTFFNHSWRSSSYCSPAEWGSPSYPWKSIPTGFASEASGILIPS